MRNGYQLSLFGGGPGKGFLFDSRLLQQYLGDHRGTIIPQQEEKLAGIRQWISSLASTDATEASLESQFLTEILGGVLGYVIHPSPAGVVATAYHKPSQRITRIPRTPDVMLGDFAQEWRFTAAFELKSPGTKLDAPQPGYGNESPVDQGFYYGSRILGVRWVLVSDMRILRLYSVESQGEYEEIDLRECTDDAHFRRLYFLFSYGSLVARHEQSEIHLLYAKSTGQQLQIRDTFYELYYQIRRDLFDAIGTASLALPKQPNREELLHATQRLLDRLLFIYYCEDHPQQLLPDGTTANVTKAARSLPGVRNSKVYAALKELFREIDVGSPPASGLHVAGYNGELFKDHWIIDHIDLPDALHDKRYMTLDPHGSPRHIQGVWGLHEYDFWSELNEHLLGHIFEESLSDLHELGATEIVPLDQKLRERKKGGVFFTTSILSDFLSASALEAILKEMAPIALGDEIGASLATRLGHLVKLRAIDFACGSGAFLVSTYRLMLHEFWHLRTSLDVLATQAGAAPGLFEYKESVDQASLLRDCLAGVDLLPQAVEIAKLALWLRSAKKGEKVPNLSACLLAGDSLRVAEVFTQLNAQPASFDLVIGNPPWGGEVDPKSYQEALSELGLSADEKWDSWELFVALGLRALREGGRLALVLPDSLLYPQKAKIRKILFDMSTVEKIHSIGPDWFGKNVRMGTILLQARRGPVLKDAKMLCAMAAGDLRERAIKGEVPLTQIESQRGRWIPIQRVLSSPTYEVEVFRSVRDDEIIEGAISNSVKLEALCERGRGEEMSKTGLLWECPGCLCPTTPGKKKKGKGFEDKLCPNCQHVLRETTVAQTTLVVPVKPTGTSAVEFIDGDDISGRYQCIKPSKWLRLDLSGWDYKPKSLYTSPKILVRQAGVGLFATLDRTPARCPQSVYIYRLRKEMAAEGYRHEFVLAALVSRTMAYCVFKRFGEIDPAKAHAKLTHERLADLPIPRVDFADKAQRQLHDQIVANVGRLLNGSEHIGGAADREIETALRGLWHVDNDDGAYINGEFYDLPESQAVRDLFPNGRPRPELLAPDE